MNQNKIILFYHYLFYRSFYNNWLGKREKRHKYSNYDWATVAVGKFTTIIFVHFILIFLSIDIIYKRLIVSEYYFIGTFIVIFSSNIFLYFYKKKYLKYIIYFDDKLKEEPKIRDSKNVNLYIYGFVLLMIFILLTGILTSILHP